MNFSSLRLKTLFLVLVLLSVAVILVTNPLNRTRNLIRKFQMLTTTTFKLSAFTPGEFLGRLNKTNTIKKIQLLTGHGNYQDIAHKERLDDFNRYSVRRCRSQNYSCNIYLSGENYGQPSADLVVYFTDTLSNLRAPPAKFEDQLWAFMSGESPLTLSRPVSKAWDGLINYSLTYLPTDEYTKLAYAFSNIIRKRDVTLDRNYTSLKLKHHSNLSREANALWLVSNCRPPGSQYHPRSGRTEYALTLSRYIHVEAHSRVGSSCHEVLRNLTTPGSDSDYSGFWFYFAFENALCKGYITEKMWKILSSETLTIPVVLGGFSVTDYEKIAPPNSFIHVKNFTSPEHLARHLQYVSCNSEAFNYYMQWRNEYEIVPKSVEFDGLPTYCYLCKLAHEKPNRVWRSFSKDFSSKSCLPLLEKAQMCSYYNMTCINTASSLWRWLNVPLLYIAAAFCFVLVRYI